MLWGEKILQIFPICISNPASAAPNVSAVLYGSSGSFPRVKPLAEDTEAYLLSGEGFRFIALDVWHALEGSEGNHLFVLHSKYITLASHCSLMSSSGRLWETSAAYSRQKNVKKPFLLSLSMAMAAANYSPRCALPLARVFVSPALSFDT